MLEFAQSWSWQLKSFIAMIVILPVMVMMPMLQARFGLRPESFFIAWFMGCFFSFIAMARISPIPITHYFFPFWPMLLVFIFAFILGGPGNILLIQAMDVRAIKPPSNPALPFAIVGLAGTLAYVLNWVGGKIMPSIFPSFKFSMINLVGLILIAMGAAAVMYQKTGGQ